MDSTAEPSPNDVLTLNVGGSCTVQVLRRTLTVIDGSKLASQFSGRWENSLIRDANGHVFIDQDSRLFVPLIHYLRAKVNEETAMSYHKPPLSVQDFDGNATLFRDYLGMLDSLGLYDVLYPIRICDIMDSTAPLLPFHPMGVHMGSQETPKYYVLEVAHDVEETVITSFEIKGATNMRPNQVLVGWMNVAEEEEEERANSNNMDHNHQPVFHFPVDDYWPGSHRMMKGCRMKSFGVFFTVDKFSSEWVLKCSWDGNSKVTIQGSFGTQAEMDFTTTSKKRGKPIFGGIGAWWLSDVTMMTRSSIGE
jgi:hypothetical protein